MFWRGLRGKQSLRARVWRKTRFRCDTSIFINGDWEVPLNTDTSLAESLAVYKCYDCNYVILVVKSNVIPAA